MTLCIAKKLQEDKYVFISDSRLSDVNGKITDNATKIFKIDVKIEQTTGLFYETTYGACFSGSYLFASLIIEALGHFLSNLQEKNSNVHSFNNISCLAKKYIEKMFEQYYDENPYNDGLVIIIGGWCPIENVYKFRKFELFRKQIKDTGEIKGACKNSDMDFSKNDVYYIGSSNAEKAVKEEIIKNPEITHIEALQTIIEENKDNTIGGAIQVGLFKDRKFKIVGISTSNLVQNNYWKVEDYYCFRGLKFTIDELNDDNFLLTTQFGLPFEEKRNKMYDEANRLNELLNN